MSIQSVDRAIDILELFLTNGPSLSLKEISSSLSLAKSTTHGLIKTLEKRGFIEQDLKDQEYRLGLRAFELGNKVADTMDINKIAYPYLQDLVEEFNETVHLVLLSGNEGVYVEKKEGEGALRMYSQVGKRAPLYCTGVGKAILAFLPEEKIDSILSHSKLDARTQKTITDEKKLKEHLYETKVRGYAFDDEEIELGLKCVGAPIFNHKGEPIASISCAGPSTRFENKRLITIGLAVKNAGLQISKRLGYFA